jgi:hypothetical protein
MTTTPHVWPRQPDTFSSALAHFDDAWDALADALNNLPSSARRAGVLNAATAGTATLTLRYANPFHVGISGWTYPPWRGVFYPPGLPHRRELEYASRRMDSIEINGSFYALQRPASYQGWHDQTPPGFVVSVKGPRFVTHLKKLAGV